MSSLSKYFGLLKLHKCTINIYLVGKQFTGVFDRRMEIAHIVTGEVKDIGDDCVVVSVGSDLEYCIPFHAVVKVERSVESKELGKMADA